MIETSTPKADEGYPIMGGKVRLAWQVGGLAAILIGSYFVDGWPASLIAFGLWAILATMSDIHNERLMLIWHAVEESREAIKSTSDLPAATAKQSHQRSTVRAVDGN